jgi:hypothetical protein
MINSLVNKITTSGLCADAVDSLKESPLYSVQVGSFFTKSTAESMLLFLSNVGYLGSRLIELPTSEGTLWRIEVKQTLDKQLASDFATDLNNHYKRLNVQIIELGGSTDV